MEEVLEYLTKEFFEIRITAYEKVGPDTLVPVDGYFHMVGFDEYGRIGYRVKNIDGVYKLLKILKREPIPLSRYKWYVEEIGYANHNMFLALILKMYHAKLVRLEKGIVKISPLGEKVLRKVFKEN